MDKFFDFVKDYPTVIALIPSSIQAIVSLLTLLKRKSENQKSAYSISNSGNQINSGAYSTNTINDYSNSGNTTINNNHTYSSSSSSHTNGYDILAFWCLIFIAIVIILCFYLQNRDIILLSVFIFAFTFYIFNLLMEPKSQQLIIKTTIYIFLTALCYFFISNNYFRPNTFDAFVTQLNNTTKYMDKCILVKDNDPALYYLITQISALSFMCVIPMCNIVNNIKWLTSNKRVESVNPMIGLCIALILVFIPTILPYFISTW